MWNLFVVCHVNSWETSLAGLWPVDGEQEPQGYHYHIIPAGVPCGIKGTMGLEARLLYRNILNKLKVRDTFMAVPNRPRLEASMHSW